MIDIRAAVNHEVDGRPSMGRSVVQTQAPGVNMSMLVKIPNKVAKLVNQIVQLPLYECV